MGRAVGIERELKVYRIFFRECFFYSEFGDVTQSKKRLGEAVGIDRDPSGEEPFDIEVYREGSGLKKQNQP